MENLSATRIPNLVKSSWQVNTRMMALLTEGTKDQIACLTS